MTRRVAVCPDGFLCRLFQTPAGAEPWVFLVEDPRTRRSLGRQGALVRAGALDDEDLYRSVALSPADLVILHLPGRRPRQGRRPPLTAVLDAILSVAPEVAVLLVQTGPTGPPVPAGYPTVTSVALGRALRDGLRSDMDRAALRVRVKRLRNVLVGKERVGILLQDDPDPDALASGLALRALIGRTRPSAPLLTFGAITRPENVAMVEALEIEVHRVTPDELQRFDALAMVDVQPTFCEEKLPEVTVVIDHHPEAKGWRAPFRDVRPSYGATSTIMTEYLRAAETKITERVATALFYGIKTDTLHLERGGTRADMEAFAFLYELANHNTLRRIERPELPLDALDALGEALVHRTIIQNTLFAHLGPVSRPDLIPQFADLCLQVKGIEWSVVSGLTGSELHVSIRNVGYVRAAGEVIHAAFGDLGSAGGHRTAAKAVIPLTTWTARVGSLEPPTLRRAIVARFVRALAGEASR